MAPFISTSPVNKGKLYDGFTSDNAKKPIPQAAYDCFLYCLFQSCVSAVYFTLQSHYILLLRQKTCYVATNTNICLLRQNFVATKILVAAPAAGNSQDFFCGSPAVSPVLQYGPPQPHRWSHRLWTSTRTDRGGKDKKQQQQQLTLAKT